MKLIPVVLSGGSGTRLWPMSRTTYPKQFCPLLDKSLQNLTMNRLRGYEPSLIITSEKLLNLTQKEIVENRFAVKKVIYEPEGKNTAAAIAVACRYLQLQGLENEVIGVFSSDALIADQKAFEAAIDVAVKSAQDEKVVVLGIRPDRIETGFGYIQIDSHSNLNQASSVLKFHEKPNFEMAENFVKDGRYFWNAGIFIFKVGLMVNFFKKYQPEMWDIVSTLDSELKNLKQIYKAVKSISIDFAIIEKLQAADLSCVPCDIGWSDLGSWDILEKISSKSSENTMSQHLSQLSQKPFEVSSSANAIFSKENKVYGFVGVDDLIVVDTADATLICKKGESQKVKDLVDQLKLKSQKVVDVHNFEIRPWGQFEILKEENYFKSKMIKVEPGQKISYQSHAYRSEHWVIVKGQATVILNDEEILLNQGQHIFIPQGSKHRIINKSTEMVEFIEVQVGQSFAEEDIVRYQDDYGREQHQ